MNEFEIIRRYFERPSRDPDVLVGVGDDAAVLATRGRVAVTVDTLLEGVHFLASAPPDSIGHRALAVSLSDIAAMGARPRWATLALTLPGADPAWLEAFAAGFFALADRYGLTLVGGNLTRGPLSITVEVTGDFADDDTPMMRAGGTSGDDIYVTGWLGDAAAGLEWLTKSGHDLQIAPTEGADSTVAPLIERYLRPEPRVEAGRALARHATAAIDVSDGLVSDLAHLCRASACGAIVDVEMLPLSPALEANFGAEDALRLALSGGDDYELCFTAPPDAANAVAQALERSRTSGRPIGRLTGRTGEGIGIVWRRGGEPFAPRAGYMHFR
jgi:thiamine-monophosphate kinase